MTIHQPEISGLKTQSCNLMLESPLNNVSPISLSFSSVFGLHHLLREISVSLAAKHSTVFSSCSLTVRLHLHKRKQTELRLNFASSGLMKDEAADGLLLPEECYTNTRTRTPAQAQVETTGAHQGFVCFPETSAVQ